MRRGEELRHLLKHPRFQVARGLGGGRKVWVDSRTDAHPSGTNKHREWSCRVQRRMARFHWHLPTKAQAELVESLQCGLGILTFGKVATALLTDTRRGRRAASAASFLRRPNGGQPQRGASTIHTARRQSWPARTPFSTDQTTASARGWQVTERRGRGESRA